MPVLRSIDAVGMTIMSTSTPTQNTIIHDIKEEYPNVPVIIGGPHCTIFPRRALAETNADICVQGDGEEVILDIKDALHDEKKLNDIPGVFYKTAEGIGNGPAFQPIQDLNTIPFPSRDLIKKYLYGKAYNPSIKKGEFTSILTSRGCPYHCKFCSRNAISLNMFRTRTTKNILDELEEIRALGYKYLGIMDDSSLYNKKQAHEIFDSLIKEHFDMKIYITASRADSADKDLYQKMKKAGVISIQYGLESANQEVLDFYNKKTTVEQIRNAVILGHQAGFFTSGTFVLGAPFETKDQFRNTVKFAQSLPLDSASFLPLRYRAYTELWLDAVKTGIITSNDYEIYADSNRGLGRYPEKELLRYCQNAQRLFYFRPKYFLHLMKSSLKNNDFSIFHMLVSISLSEIKEQILQKSQPSKNNPNNQQHEKEIDKYYHQ